MSDDRDETDDERADRNWAELLQELRVSQTGVQILFGFLLTLPFTQRFGDLSEGQRRLYFVTLLLAVAATAVLIAPVAYHRLVFQQRRKQEAVATANVLTLVGLGLLALAVTAAIALVADVLYGRGTSLATGGALLTVIVGLWVVLPLVGARRSAALDRSD